MFGYGYKEDALKWRQREKELMASEISRKFRMTVEVVLKDGDTQYKTDECQGYAHDVGWGKPEYVVKLGRDKLEEHYNKVKELAGTKGLQVDSGMFIPHSNIHHIRMIGIVEVQQ